jgi:hypothetical protein
MEYDLSEFRDLPWVKLVRAFRVALGTFAILAIAYAAYGTYRVAREPDIGHVQIVQLLGFGLAFFVLGTMLVVAILSRRGASKLVIDGAGVRLEYGPNRADFRPWDIQGVLVRGRRTDGVRDSVSRGLPLRSIFGRNGGFQETFLTEAAFGDLLSEARSRGFELTERAGRTGWQLYSLSKVR